MDSKELNETLIAHQIMAFAIELSRSDKMAQLDTLPAGQKAEAKPLEAFVPQAVKRYMEIRAAIKAALP